MEFRFFFAMETADYTTGVFLRLCEFPQITFFTRTPPVAVFVVNWTSRLKSDAKIGNLLLEFREIYLIHNFFNRH